MKEKDEGWIPVGTFMDTSNLGGTWICIFDAYVLQAPPCTSLYCDVKKSSFVNGKQHCWHDTSQHLLIQKH